MRKFHSLLLVDDDEIANHLHFHIFQKKINIEANIVLNGKEALDYIINHTKSIDENSFILLLLDINMPVTNGWEFLESFSVLDQEIRDKVIIFILTTSENPEDLIRARNTKEVFGFINKPLSQKKIEMYLSAYLPSTSRDFAP